MVTKSSKGPVVAPRAPAAAPPSRSLLSRALRVEPDALEAAFAQMRLEERNKKRVWAVLVDGRDQVEVADTEGVSRELISALVRRVRKRLNGMISPWTIVEVKLALPLTLAEEMRGLVDALSRMPDRSKAEALLLEVQKVTALAKSKALYDR